MKRGSRYWNAPPTSGDRIERFPGRGNADGRAGSQRAVSTGRRRTSVYSGGGDSSSRAKNASHAATCS
jgi:hypothetical protein